MRALKVSLAFMHTQNIVSVESHMRSELDRVSSMIINHKQPSSNPLDNPPCLHDMCHEQTSDLVAEILPFFFFFFYYLISFVFLIIP
jgi:hypothetical protein